TMNGSRGALALVCVAVACVLFGAQTARTGDDFKLEPGYTSLFNGKDLSGWKYGKDKLDGKSETADKRFQVENGVIVVNAGKGIKDLYTVDEFNKDFHLKLEFRASLKSDSGVYIRGKQLQVRDYPRFGGQYSKVPGFKLDDWNELDITVKGGFVTTT